MKPVARIAIWKLIDFMRRFLPKDRFHMAEFGNDDTAREARRFVVWGGSEFPHPKLPCCNGGWLLALYGVELKLAYYADSEMTYDGQARTGSSENMSIVALREALGISRENVRYLFLPSEFGASVRAADMTPQMVADRMQAFMTVYEPTNRMRIPKYKRKVP